MVCGSSLRDILSFGFFYTWLHSSHPFPTSVFMKTFPINLCRRELSTFPLSPAKDAVFLCDELVRDYPAEIFSVEVNLYHFSRSGLAMDIGWAGSASRAVQDPCNPQMLILDGKASPECPEERTSKEWLRESADSPSELLLCSWGGWCSSHPPHCIRTLLAQTINMGFWPGLKLWKVGTFPGRFLAPWLQSHEGERLQLWWNKSHQLCQCLGGTWREEEQPHTAVSSGLGSSSSRSALTPSSEWGTGWHSNPPRRCQCGQNRF